MSCDTHLITSTSFHELEPFIHHVFRHFVVSHKLLESEAREASAPEVEVSRQAEDSNDDRVVDVETRLDEGQ